MTFKKETALVTGVFCSVVVLTLIIVVAVVTAPYRKTRKICSDAVEGYVNSNVLPDNVKDAWGDLIEFTAQPSPTQVIYIARSAGPDKKFGTDDDIVETRIDYNKSRIVGEWIGSRTKELVKGVYSGATKPSKFESKQ